jgi:hypothetical protein
MESKMRTKVNAVLALAILVAVAGAAPAQAAPEPATQADIKRLDHEIEMLKSELSKIQNVMNQHSKPHSGMGTGQSAMGQPGPGMQGGGNQQNGMPMMDDDSMEMPPMGSGQQQGGGMPSGGMGDM